jgi:streptogramin lyase
MVNGNAADATFSDPAGVAIDAKGFIYVSDLGNNAIRSISTDGQVTTVAGTGNYIRGYKDGDGSVAQFNNPEGMAVDATGAIYVADLVNNCIRKITIQVVN